MGLGFQAGRLTVLRPKGQRDICQDLSHHNKIHGEDDGREDAKAGWPQPPSPTHRLWKQGELVPGALLLF